MLTDITHVTILVEDQDEALEFYTETLGLVVRDDDEFEMEGEAGRWLTVSPPGEEFPQLALVEADNEAKRERVGSQVGGHVNLVFQTDDFDAEYERLLDAGVTFHGEPMENPWGTEITFEDPYGNVHDLMEAA
ncbi:VOC family protein [Salinirubellus salinus]|jgi:catechol 2,3-dioxygenase-like lactoylglutathione lyase family enzyme|uniref:VOC family protein n=1 Tax=Salinirubellus salinus TaxID=1364945 RepID=A0A9E7R4C2_9EURY|nr:VOC family protein [Salinirubellus salinus]UWM55377.1 VOC family protein [Salinirubellus salinus]